MTSCDRYLVEKSCDAVEVHEIKQTSVEGTVPVAKGEWNRLGKKVKPFIARWIGIMQPRGVYICDGTKKEADEIKHKLEERNVLHKLKKMDNCYVCRTDPADVARVESKTWICTKDKYATVPHVKPGVQGILGQWKSYEEAQKHLDLFYGCMKGRMMYVIPFSMGPIGSPLSEIGIEITDSNYVVLCMQVMTRMGHHVLDVLGDNDFVKCVHSMGSPRPSQRKTKANWPCNPEKVFISHFPEKKLIASFGSGYGGNSLLGKKCFALRIASNMARDEGWLAEHMLIMGLQCENTGKERFISAAFPSACGKTNMAMLRPTIKGYKVTCIGDDIAWMRFDDKGVLRGINPENGFFGVCPGTSSKTNYYAMKACMSNTIFTNTGMTRDGWPYWEGMRDEIFLNLHVPCVDWKGNEWLFELEDQGQGKCAHPNSRFTAPAAQCEIMHPKWQDPKGVPISAFIFGGRRPVGVPLIYEAYSWEHGVAIAACVKSEATAAAEHAGKKIMHDPMAMRPFMGYNFGRYLDHWLSLNKAPHKLPKIFHANWFRLDSEGNFLWPGFGDNIRVLDWIIRRCDGDETIAEKTPIGYIPKKGSINLSGLGEIKWDELMSLPPDYWKMDCAENLKYLNDQVGSDLPQRITQEINEILTRFNISDQQQQQQKC